MPRSKFDDEQIEKLILEETANIIFNYGIKSWNADQLSKRVGLAKNTLYRIIVSKEALIQKVILHYIKGVQAKLVTIICTEPDYLKALNRLIEEFPELINNMFTDSMQEIMNEYPLIEKSVLNHRDELTKNILAFIQKGIDTGFLRSDLKPEILFEILQAIVLSNIKSGLKGQELSNRIYAAFKYLTQGILA